MEARRKGESKYNPYLAARAAKRDIDRGALERSRKHQAKTLGFSPARVRAQACKAERGLPGLDLLAGPDYAGVGTGSVSRSVGNCPWPDDSALWSRLGLRAFDRNL